MDRQFISLKGIVYVCEYACVCVSRSVVSDQAPLPTRVCVCVCVLVAQLCPTLCNPMDYSSPGSSVHGILQAEESGVGSHPLFRGSKPRSLNYRWILYCLSHQESPG